MMKVFHKVFIPKLVMKLSHLLCKFVLYIGFNLPQEWGTVKQKSLFTYRWQHKTDNSCCKWGIVERCCVVYRLFLYNGAL